MTTGRFQASVVRRAHWSDRDHLTIRLLRIFVVIFSRRSVVATRDTTATVIAALGHVFAHIGQFTAPEARNRVLPDDLVLGYMTVVQLLCLIEFYSFITSFFFYLKFFSFYILDVSKYLDNIGF